MGFQELPKSRKPATPNVVVAEAPEKEASMFSATVPVRKTESGVHGDLQFHILSTEGGTTCGGSKGGMKAGRPKDPQ